MASTKHHIRIGGESVNRADAHFCDSVKARCPKMASSLVRVMPLLPERFETPDKQFLPARIVRALIHEESGQHRAGAAPCNSPRISDPCFDIRVELPRDIFGGRQFPLQKKNS